MNDLISRSALLAAVNDAIATSERLEANPKLLDAATVFRMMVEQAPAIVPQIVVNISGGLMQGASSTHSVEVISLDFDTDCFDDDSIGVMVDGSEAYRSIQTAEVDPEFVTKVASEPMLFLKDDTPVCTDCDGIGQQYHNNAWSLCEPCLGSGEQR